MKIGIIGFAKIKYMPYLNFYLDCINRMNSNKYLDVFVIEWDRENVNQTKQEYKIDGVSKVYSFQNFQLDEVRKISKVKNFFLYRKYTKSIIKKEKFDKLILLHTFPAVLLFDLLMTKYRERYIFDYRDFTYEKISLFKYIIGLIVKKSNMTFVSSDGFREYLPRLSKIYTSHNLDMETLKYKGIRKSINRKQDRLRISFWGLIRHEKINIKLISDLQNDPRFEIHYYGREQQTAKNLKEYCMHNGVKNVFFHGTYEPSQKVDFAKKTDIVHNLYDNETQMNLAMGNKYYDAIVFSIPQLCLCHSYMGDRITDKDIGLSIPIDQNVGDKIYDYYQNINWDIFDDNIKKEVDIVVKEYMLGQKKIREFIERRN